MSQILPVRPRRFVANFVCKSFVSVLYRLLWCQDGGNAILGAVLMSYENHLNFKCRLVVAMHVSPTVK